MTTTVDIRSKIYMLLKSFMNNNGNKRKKRLESRILASKGQALLDCEIIELLLYAVHPSSYYS